MADWPATTNAAPVGGSAVGTLLLDFLINSHDSKHLPQQKMKL
jgi:hypothetical protein